MSKCGEVARSEPDVLSIMGKGRRDRQRALFSKFFFSKVFQVLAIAAPDLEFFPLRCGTSSVRWARADRALFPLSRRDAPGESRCLRCRRAAVPSTLRDYRNTSNRQRNGYARLRIFSLGRFNPDSADIEHATSGWPQAWCGASARRSA